MALVACHTDGCVNQDIVIEVEHPLDEETGKPCPDANWTVCCGGCDQPITDISDDADSN